ncbi:hypothetical protein, partial [Mitsuaria sp. GD03876]|uniref:ligand-binding sensor domain-containing protein n=1 Tax=Mitsuaria sp. GD03876 TaxID=2975399 RepID=UPI0024477D78
MGSSTETTAGRRRLALPASAALALLALLTALLALLAPRDVHAGEHIVLSSYQEREGLQNLTPTCLLQDRRSVLWICTENGLFRFDGFQVHAEPTPPAIGTVLWGGRLDPLGRLWLTTDRGLFVRLPPASTGHADETDRPARWVGIVRPDGKPLDIVLAQQFDIDAQGGLVAFDRDFRYWTASIDDATASATVQARPLAVPAHLRSRGTPFVDSSPLRLLGGQLWFGCGEVLCSWDRRQPAVTRWAQAQGLPDDSWATLFVGRDGSLWARGRTHLARLAPGAQRFEVTAAPSPSPTWEASSPTAEDAQGRILTATEHGLARWDGRAWQAWSREEGLPDAALRVLLTDADGALWLGASGQGIHRWIGYGEVDHWTRDSGLPSGVVFRIVQDGSGRVWAFTRQGAAWFDAARHRFVALRGTPAAGGDFSGAVVDDAGDLWWLDNGQLMTVKAGSATARPVLRDPSLLVLLRGHGGTLFLVAKDRVEALVPSAARPRRTPIAPGLPGGLPPIELFSDGTTDWFVNTARQAYRVQGDGWVPLLDVRGQRATGASPVLSGGLLWTMDDNGIV